MRRMMLKYLFAVLLVAAAVWAPGRTMASGSILVSDAWTRAIPMQDGTALIYVTITDIGAPDKLLGVSSPIAAAGGLRETTIVDGVARGIPIKSLPVTSDEPTILAPGGKQVVLLTGMSERLQEGKHFPITLNFERGGAVGTTVLIRSADYTDPIETMK